MISPLFFGKQPHQPSLPAFKNILTLAQICSLASVRKRICAAYHMIIGSKSIMSSKPLPPL